MQTSNVVAGMESIQTTEHWQSIFENWPDVIPRRGIIVSKYGETIPFANFLISEGLLLVERDGPDASGTRRAILGYDSISMVKLASNAELSQFMSMGFQTTI